MILLQIVDMYTCLYFHSTRPLFLLFDVALGAQPLLVFLSFWFFLIHVYSIRLFYCISLTLFLLQSFNNVTGDEFESFVNIKTTFSTGFKELHIVFFGNSFTHFFCDYFLISHISFITQKNNFDILSCVVLHLSHPICDVFKWLSTGRIISHDDSLSTSIVCLSDRSESFLSCSIPNLYFNLLPIKIYCSNFKVNT